jgi:hypothetical protein
LQNAKWVEKGLENLMEAARLEPKRLAYLREATRELFRHGRAEEALLFAGRAVHLDPSSANQQLLDLVTGSPQKKAEAAVPPAAAPVAPEPVAKARRRRRRSFLTRFCWRRA